MNPLDKLELLAFCRNLKEEMPMHTESTAKIKRSYSQGMPKNLMDYSAFVNNHFLNDNLAIIEEMQHRDKSHPIPKWFREYQLRHYAKYGILKGDHFFGAKLGIIPDLGEHRGIGFLPFTGINLGFGTIGDTKVLGADIEANSSPDGHGAGFHTMIRAYVKAVPVVGAFYDRVAINFFGGGSNYRMAVYTDSSGPSTIIMETSNIPCTTGFNWNSVTEFSIGVSSVYLAEQIENGTPDCYRVSAASRYHKSQSYGAFTTGGFTSGTDSGLNIKIGHS